MSAADQVRLTTIPLFHEPWILRPLESTAASSTGDDSPFLSAILSAVGLAEAEASATADPTGVAMNRSSPPEMKVPCPCRPGAPTRRCERPSASMECIFTVVFMHCVLHQG